MANFFVFLFLVALIAWVVALIRPGVYKKYFKHKATRKKLSKYFGLAALVLFIAIGITAPPAEKDTQTSNAQTTERPEKVVTQSANETKPVEPVNNKFTVAKVIDGDTIDLNINGKTERIRLVGIDTPEKNDPRKTVECFSSEASAKLTELTKDKKIELEADGSQDNKDKYSRLLRYLWVDGVNINQKMIEEGYAYEYTYKLPYKYQTAFKATQKKASDANKGLWADDSCNGQRTKPAPQPVAAPAPAPTPAPKSAPAAAPPQSNCDPNYTPCVPNVSHDLDCADIGHSVTVTGIDHHRLDRDGNGSGCEAY